VMVAPDRQLIDGVGLRDLIPVPWMARAACADADPDLFFGEAGHPGDEAKAICHGCPVRQSCLDYAIEHSERFGIWGGLTFKQRLRFKRDRVA